MISASRARPPSSTAFKYLHGFNFTRAVTEYGYNSEQHTVITEDGYILTVFRLLPPKKCLGKTRKPPVLLMHGLLLSADSWIVAGPNIGLGYLITDLCFDLWIGNSRGNTYSRKHITLNPDKNLEFWNYSYTEFGRYDLSAMIDYILEATGSDNNNNNKNGLIAKSLDCHLERLSLGGWVKGQIQKAALLDTARIVRRFLDQLGSITTCINFTSERTIKDAYKTFPSGTSVKNIAHIGQLLQSYGFKKYDYADEKNIKIYGASKPPSYDLSRVSTPVVVFYGLNDALVDPKDISWLVKQLPNVLEVYQVADPMWNHEDFTYCKFVKDLLLPKIKEYLVKCSI
ncbi:hypothetical protein K1T71_012798 [Dendrolimus kikuchii]|uniref:Uncharacterized protein n=1 Tax=Dendrolimus kikuchii TaxID=765133 RepID=A0ACC1CI32_9NEOP|nr:hypothetical protein K1T71_012798 [Dendrolimus kikuchii]